MMPIRPDLRRRAPLLVAVALAILVVALAFRWWDRYVEDGLGRWAVGELARRTDGTYRLVLGDLAATTVTPRYRGSSSSGSAFGMD